MPPGACGTKPPPPGSERDAAAVHGRTLHQTILRALATLREDLAAHRPSPAFPDGYRDPADDPRGAARARMLEVLRAEMAAEGRRAAEVLRIGSGRRGARRRAEVAQERAEAADGIMRLLHEGRFVSPAEYASYLEHVVHMSASPYNGIILRRRDTNGKQT